MLQEAGATPVSYTHLVVSYTQALAAAVTKYGELKKHAASYIIDIGGYTVDVLKLRYGKPDLEMCIRDSTYSVHEHIRSCLTAYSDPHWEKII